MTTKLKISGVVLLLLSLGGCKVGPNYKRPTVTVPTEYRGATPPTAGQQGQPFGEMQWESVFQDQALQGLIKEALTNNYDIRIAATRVLEANANLGIVRSNQFPSVGASYGLAQPAFHFGNQVERFRRYHVRFRCFVDQLHCGLLGAIPACYGGGACQLTCH